MNFEVRGGVVVLILLLHSDSGVVKWAVEYARAERFRYRSHTVTALCIYEYIIKHHTMYSVQCTALHNISESDSRRPLG